MRAVLWLGLLVLALPLAGAQQPAPDAVPRFSLTVDPQNVEAPPGGSATIAIFIENPSRGATKWTLDFVGRDGGTIRFDVPQVVVGANARERVGATVFIPAHWNATHEFIVFANETTDSAQASGRAAPIQLRAPFRASPGPVFPNERPMPADAQPEPQPRMFLRPPDVRMQPGDRRGLTLVVQNPTDREFPLEFRAESPTGILIEFHAPQPMIGPRSAVDVPVSVTARPEMALGSHRAMISSSAARASPVGLAIEIVPPPIRPQQEPVVVDTDPPLEPTVRADDPGVDPRVVGAIVAAGVAGAWTSLWLTRRTWLPLLAALYTRLRPNKMLDHPVRARIVALVKERPGITFGDLARAVDVAPGQLTHHARMLEKAGIVFSSPDGQTRRFFHVAEGRRPAAVAPLAERVLTLVRERPRHASALAKDLGVSRQALHYHVRSLVAEGRLVARADGREVWLEVSEPSSVAPGLARS